MGASLSPSVDRGGGVILDLLLFPKAGLSPSIQNVTRPDYVVCEPTAQVFLPHLCNSLGPQTSYSASQASLPFSIKWAYVHTTIYINQMPTN